MRISDWSSDVCSSDLAKRDQIISVGRILVARMDRQETLRRLDRLSVVAAHIIAERAHQLRPAGPGGIGMLAFNLVEQCGRKLVLPAIKPIFGGIVNRSDVAGDIICVGFVLAGGASRQERYRKA